MCAPGISNSIYLQKAGWDEFCDGSFAECGSIFYNSGCQIIKYKAFIYCCSPPFPFVLVIVFPMVARYPPGE